MVYCAVVGCKSVSPCEHSFFKFPVDPKLRDLWRARLKRSETGGRLWMPTKHSKVCSRHFAGDAFTVPPSLAQEMGYSVSRRTLKADAVPSLHLGYTSACQAGPSTSSPKPAFVKRQRKRVVAETLSRPEPDIEDIAEAPAADPLSCAGAPDEPPPVHVPCTTSTKSTQVNKVTHDVGTQASIGKPKQYVKGTQTSFSLSKSNRPLCCSAAVQTITTLYEQQSTQCDLLTACVPSVNQNSVYEDEESDDDSDSDYYMDVDEDDLDYIPSDEDEEIDSDLEFENIEEEMEIPDEASPIDERKYLVFESCIKSLLMVCTVCLAGCRVTISQLKGTLVVFHSVCTAGHERFWYSQPLHKKMTLGNLLSAAGIYFSGVSAAKVIHFFRSINCKIFSNRTLCYVQSAYLIPSVNAVWRKHQLSLLDERKDRVLSLGGDGRCCSPGHTAKFGSYSLMDLQTKEVLDVQLIQSNQVKNSNAMELSGLKKSLSFLHSHSVKVGSLVTDRHVQVKKYMRTEQPDINHWFDVWHVAKGVKKKIESKSKKKGFEDLQKWVPSIVNHVYWCAVTSGGDGELVKQKWLSMSNHVVNIHEGHGDRFPRCLHPDMYREWIEPDSCEHKALKDVIEKTYLVNDMKKLSPVDQTSHLEAYHKVVCHFASKFLQYPYNSMYARLLLSVLHFNENVKRKQASTKSGTLRWALSFPKAKHGEAVAKKIKGDCTYDYVTELLEEVLRLREEVPSVKLAIQKAKETQQDTPPAVCTSYSNYSQTDKIKVVETQMNRFN